MEYIDDAGERLRMSAQLLRSVCSGCRNQEGRKPCIHNPWWQAIHATDSGACRPPLTSKHGTSRLRHCCYCTSSPNWTILRAARRAPLV